MKSTLAVIMGGGRGTRLQPLTATRSKPAVPIAGKYRLVDIPISNCINSNIRRIYVLTQFNTESLHRHITEAYHFDHFSRDFVRILAAQQTFAGDVWYQGTADAVRQNINYLLERPYQYYVILSGDQLYSMDFRQMLKAHLDCKADVTIATTPVTRDKAEGFGIMKTDASGQITNFVEKPKDPSLLENLKLTPAQLRESGFDAKDERYQASMGIYIFSRKALEDCLLGNSMMDFGREIIPAAIRGSKVQSYLFKGYWEDIGTIRSFHQANLELTDLVPNYNFFDLEN
ncbi:MAG: sugar phosphate nucleotidyltransferase, partial [Verrucomicrobiales bacterium]